MNNLDSVAIYTLVSNHLLKFVVERILPEQANLQRSIRPGKRIGRPFHKLRKIEEERRLNLIFSGRFRLRNHSQAAQSHPDRMPFPMRSTAPLNERRAPLT